MISIYRKNITLYEIDIVDLIYGPHISKWSSCSELQKMIIDLFMDNARLRKKINCFTRYALKIDRSVSDDSPVDTVTSNGMN